MKTFRTHQKHGEGLKTAGKNLIYIILICLICGTIAFGFCVLQAYYIDGCGDQKNSTILGRNSVKLEYKWPENVEKVINDVIDNNDRMTMNDDRGVLIKAELMKFDTRKSNYSDVPKELMANFKDTNFIGLIGKEFEVSVRSANSFGRIWGPGYWDTVAVLDSEGNKTGKEFILVAGYI
ncbi:hypothetical protein B9Z55_012748 [Caenorhabditis nigoni]|uniref:Uncharacterized protein n=1 Tax=Caenorhabditis nigoni TaxID=1611254 RepID=A0A2G5TYP0_9PELO|nr:hypothetical protein B9Z55_012748 [Caenorhabditis nigoni]